jgi:hypothetical protein
MLSVVFGLLLVSSVYGIESACKQMDMKIWTLVATKPYCFDWQTFDADDCLGSFTSSEEGLKFCECFEERLKQFNHDLDFPDFCHDRFEEHEQENPEEYEERHKHC